MYELHITDTEENIQRVSDIVKTIAVRLITPDLLPIRTEHMTSQCYKDFIELVRFMSYYCKNVNMHPTRIKIETYYSNGNLIRFNDTLYLESHWYSDDLIYPTSWALHKPGKLLATDRTYDKSEYEEFAARYKREQLELCLYDTFVEQDKDWMELYK